MKSTINPVHYKSHPSGVECIDMIYPLSYSEGNAIKYMWRIGMKDRSLYELGKAMWYVDKIISTKIITDQAKIPEDSRRSFLRWSKAQAEGHQKKAITYIYCGYPEEAKKEIELWMKTIKM